MKGSGKTIKLMALESLLTLIMLGMRVCGKMICSMVRAKRSGMMVVLNTLDSFIKVKRMEKENFNGKMGVTMKETLLMDNFQDLVYITLQT